jgi:hypothetical protein
VKNLSFPTDRSAGAIFFASLNSKRLVDDVWPVWSAFVEEAGGTMSRIRDAAIRQKRYA